MGEKPTSPAQAELWSAHARDWAEVMEGWNGWGVPVYRRVLEGIEVGRGTSVLDVGCGAGRFLRMAADRGASVSGLDATPAFVEIAAERLPDADLRVGDMEELPWPDDAFDVVTGFNSFFIAGDMVRALGEARRVARTGGSVAMTVFGRPERCQSTAMFKAVAALLPEGSSGNGKTGRPLHEEGALEDLARQAGLRVQDSGYLGFRETYPDLDTLLRGVMAAPPMVRAGRAVGRDAVRAALSDALGPCETPTGRYELQEEIRYLIAVA